MFIFLHFSTFDQRGKHNRSAYSKNTSIKIVHTPISIGSEDCSLFPACLGLCMGSSGLEWELHALSSLMPPSPGSCHLPLQPITPGSCLSSPAAPPAAGQWLRPTWLPLAPCTAAPCCTQFRRATGVPHCHVSPSPHLGTRSVTLSRSRGKHISTIGFFSMKRQVCSLVFGLIDSVVILTRGHSLLWNTSPPVQLSDSPGGRRSPALQPMEIGPFVCLCWEGSPLLIKIKWKKINKKVKKIK